MIADLRRPIMLVIVALVILAAHALLVRVTAEGHAAHALLGAGNAAPPLGPAVLAVSLVIVRLLAIVVVPGMILAGATEIAARFIVGPKGSRHDESSSPMPSSPGSADDGDARAHSARMVDATLAAAGDEHR